MTDQYHKCARCKCVYEADILSTDPHSPLDCIAALQREVAAKDAEIAALRKSNADARQYSDGLDLILKASVAACDTLEKECTALRADVERVAVAFHLWPGASGDMAQAFAAFRASKDWPGEG